MLVPAICESCGLAFARSNIIGGDTSHVRVAFENVTTNCPRCQGQAKIIDGVYEGTGGALRILATSDRSKSQIEALRNALQTAIDLRLSPTNISETIKTHAPELQSFSDLIPKTRNEAYTLIKIVIAALTLLLASGLIQRKEVSDEEIGKMIDKAIATGTQQSAQLHATSNRRQRRAAGRPPKPARHK